MSGGLHGQRHDYPSDGATDKLSGELPVCAGERDKTSGLDGHSARGAACLIRRGSAGGRGPPTQAATEVRISDQSTMSLRSWKYHAPSILTNTSR